MINFDEIDFFKALEKFSKEVKYRYCIPGHDRNDEVINYLAKNLSRYDVTETIGTDDLNHPESFIKKSLEDLAYIYGSERTFISVNGSSGAIINAILSVTKPHDKILLQRDCHKSAYNACILGDLIVEYVYPKYNSDYDLNLGITCESLKLAIENNDDIKAFVLTYPSYKGICSDVASIAKLCHEHGIILIVDEAHGAHFAFSDRLPLAAEHSGADIVIQSMHKTLPALTQTSLLHVCSNRVDCSRLESMFKLTITSSPSYIFMGSIMAAVHFMQIEGRKKIDDILDRVALNNTKYDKLTSCLINKKLIQNIGAYDFDESRPILSLFDYGVDGSQLEELLRNNYHIAMEYSDIRYCVGYFTVNDQIDKIDYLYQSMFSIINDVKKSASIKTNFYYRNYKYPKNERIIDMRQAFYSDTEIKDLEEAENYICGDFIIPYPPGIPLICPGERITRDLISYINELIDDNIKIYGLDKKNIRIIK